MVLHDNVPIKLKKVTKMNHRFLYQLLKERDATMNISHKKMPSYDEHVKFVLSKPYMHWKIIYYNNKRIGSVYLTRQNEIGIFIKKEFQGKNIGSQILELMIEQNGPVRYLANINPKNKKSISFFKKHGFKIIQHTYEFLKS